MVPGGGETWGGMVPQVECNELVSTSLSLELYQKWLLLGQVVLCLGSDPCKQGTWVFLKVVTVTEDSSTA